MENVKFNIGEVVSFLEELILNEEATKEQLEFYEDWKWDGVCEKGEVLRGLIEEMKENWG